MPFPGFAPLLLLALGSVGTFSLAQRVKRWDIADVFWGPWIVAFSIVSAHPGLNFSAHRWAAVLLVLWMLRLSVYIWGRWRKHSEDPRYARWRKDWGPKGAVRAYFQIFLLQPLLAWAVSLAAAPVWSAPQNPQDFAIIWIFLVVAALGLGLESWADASLNRFLESRSQTGVCRVGPWRYSRHPNYLGEAVFWVGLGGFSSVLTQSLAPALAGLLPWVLVRYVSGVPLLEARWAQNPKYRAYIEEVPLFFPWPRGLFSSKRRKPTL